MSYAGPPSARAGLASFETPTFHYRGPSRYVLIGVELALPCIAGNAASDAAVVR